MEQRPMDNAHKVLDIYAHLNGRAGQILISNQLLAVALRWRLDVLDLQNGIREANRRGWIERAVSGGWRLTDAGFRETAGAQA